MRKVSLPLLLVLMSCSSHPNQMRIDAISNLRRATPNDVDRMVAISAVSRAQYAAYSKIFWHPAVEACEKQRKYFHELVVGPAWICLVHGAADEVDGFIIARVVSAPPVYDPGGKVCMIDDFAVVSPTLWSSVGRALQARAEQIAADNGAVISVIVCGQRDAAKSRELQNSGGEVASEWYVHSIQR